MAHYFGNSTNPWQASCDKAWTFHHLGCHRHEQTSSPNQCCLRQISHRRAESAQQHDSALNFCSSGSAPASWESTLRIASDKSIGIPHKTCSVAALKGSRLRLATKRPPWDASFFKDPAARVCPDPPNIEGLCAEGDEYYRFAQPTLLNCHPVQSAQKDTAYKYEERYVDLAEKGVQYEEDFTQSSVKRRHRSPPRKPWVPPGLHVTDGRSSMEDSAGSFLKVKITLLASTGPQMHTKILQSFCSIYLDCVGVPARSFVYMMQS